MRGESSLVDGDRWARLGVESREEVGVGGRGSGGRRRERESE